MSNLVIYINNPGNFNNGYISIFKDFFTFFNMKTCKLTQIGQRQNYYVIVS